MRESLTCRTKDDASLRCRGADSGACYGQKVFAALRAGCIAQKAPISSTTLSSEEIFDIKGKKDYQMYRRQVTNLVKFSPEGGRGSLFLAGCRWSTRHRSHLVVLARPAVATRFPHRDRRAHVSARLLTARASSSGGVPVATIALVNDTAPSESSYRTEAHTEQCHRAAAF